MWTPFVDLTNEKDQQLLMNTSEAVHGLKKRSVPLALLIMAVGAALTCNKKNRDMFVYIHAILFKYATFLPRTAFYSCYILPVAVFLLILNILLLFKAIGIALNLSTDNVFRFLMLVILNVLGRPTTLICFWHNTWTQRPQRGLEGLVQAPPGRRGERP